MVHRLASRVFPLEMGLGGGGLLHVLSAPWNGYTCDGVNELCVDGHLDCFPYFAVMNNAAKRKTLAHTPLPWR